MERARVNDLVKLSMLLPAPMAFSVILLLVFRTWIQAQPLTLFMIVISTTTFLTVEAIIVYPKSPNIKFLKILATIGFCSLVIGFLLAVIKTYVFA